MNSSKAILIASQFMKTIDAKLDGLKLGNGIKDRVSAALLHLSLEHFAAIIVLLQNQLSASAAALARPQYEALIRGIYFYQCASEKEAQGFSDGIDPPKIKLMIQRIEEIPGFTSGGFSRVHQRQWNAMNSYTHGGAAQIERRFFGADLTKNYSEPDLINLIQTSKVMALFASTHAAIACDSLETAKEIHMAFGKYLLES